MKLHREAHPLTHYLNQQKQLGKSIGFVPTMGALHLGHASLIKQSNAENDLTVVSIFVNPQQFNSQEDYQNYPITTAEDEAMLDQLGVDILFAPSKEEMYPREPLIKMSFGYLEEIMEGAFRPGHFQGVALVVAKLFHAVQPHRAYFGQKDLQQCQVIRSLIFDLSFPIEMKTVPTVREQDGLALSSRNLRLNSEQREAAPFIFQSLDKAKEGLRSGKSIEETIAEVEAGFGRHHLLNLEYFRIVDSDNLKTIDKITDRQVSLCIAVHAGAIRLIDNIYLYD